jgi:putative endonuclease
MGRLGGTILRWERRIYSALRRHADARRASRALRAGHRPQPAHLVTGEMGEDAAFFHLRELGYTVVARRWRSDRLASDLDLVAWDGATLVIFEVKTRTARDSVPAEQQVDPAKQKLLRRMASAYVRQFPEVHRENLEVRFDVLSVYLLPSGAEFDHLPNAFPFLSPRRF